MSITSTTTSIKVCFIIILTILFLSKSSSKLFVENILENSDHEVLNNHRVVIDAAISVDQVKSIMEIVNKSPSLLVKNPRHRYSKEEVALHEFRNANDIKAELGEIVHKIKFPKNVNLNRSKTIRLQEDFFRIEPLIVDYAEAFYKKKFKIFTSVLFVRTHVRKDWIVEESPEEVNQGEGWLVQTHVDGCLLYPETWTCSVYGFSHIATDYIYRDVSAVLFLNDLQEDGGEFVFIDPTDREVQMVTPDPTVIADLENARNNGTDEVKKAGGYPKPFDPTRQRHLREEAYRFVSIPPPPRHEVRRALKEQKMQADSTSYSVKPGKFSKLITIPSKHINYSMVMPKARRLLLFNASKENVHAVTQIINQNDRRYTWFLSLTVLKDY